MPTNNQEKGIHGKGDKVVIAMPTNNQEKWEERFDEEFNFGDCYVDENTTSRIKSFIRQAKIEMEDKIIDIVSTHDVGDGRYCDTGEDMEWGCRSECVEKAVERIHNYFSNLKNNDQPTKN